MTFADIDPPARLLMGPGPVNAHPRVLRAMSAQMLGQFDPEFTAYMNETMALYRLVFQTENRWTFLIDGTARAAIEAALVSVLEPGDRLLVANIGRFGSLLEEIGERCGAEITTVSAEWGQVLSFEALEAAIAKVRPKLFATIHGDTSTTMAQPLEGVGEVCRRYGALCYVDATATLGGMDVAVDRWGADIVTAGLQKCLGGPPGSAPITLSDRAAELIMGRRHVERGLGASPAAAGRRIASNYFDLAMLMDYWSERRLNHHTEATTMLYGARECARIVVEEGLSARISRHAACGAAMAAGVSAIGLQVYGDSDHRMTNVTAALVPPGVDGETVRTAMRTDFGIEIGTAFGPLQGKVWRIGAMGFNATRPAVLSTLAALEAVLRMQGWAARSGVEAAHAVFAGRGAP
ncbi:MAG TPA: alanine--glyoxylate aminotransferase family protein [Caulobacteraceae bacterium]|jgi:(S)-ureidoglycine-glyoxylate aminotransferase